MIIFSSKKRRLGSDSRESKSHDSTLSPATILTSLSKPDKKGSASSVSSLSNPVLPAPPPASDLHYHEDDDEDNIEEAEVSIEPPPTEIVDDIVDNDE